MKTSLPLASVWPCITPSASRTSTSAPTLAAPGAGTGASPSRITTTWPIEGSGEIPGSAIGGMGSGISPGAAATRAGGGAVPGRRCDPGTAMARLAYARRGTPVLLLGRQLDARRQGQALLELVAELPEEGARLRLDGGRVAGGDELVDVAERLYELVEEVVAVLGGFDLQLRDPLRLLGDQRLLWRHPGIHSRHHATSLILLCRLQNSARSR